jgi:hypothetical protein
MTTKWIDEGRTGQPKVYTSKAWVLKLLKKIVTEDIELHKIWNGTDDELFRIGHEYLSIYEI